MFYTAFDSPLPESTFTAYMEKLPPQLRSINSKYVRWQDRTANLLGKLLLAKALAHLNFDFTLNDIKISEFNKPYIGNTFDFSISHSGRYVVCVVAIGQKAGVDIERIGDLDVNDFTNILTQREVASIQNASHPRSEFYRLWTVKESVMKGDGRGLSLPLKQIVVSDGVAQIFDKAWFLHDRDLDPEYHLTIATELPCLHLVEHCLPNSAL